MKALAMIIYFGAGIVSFFWSMAVIIENLGFIGGLIAFFVLPVTIVFAPFYVGFSTGNWMLLAITYGGGIVASIIFAMSNDE
jgi:hypothetical protein